MVKENRYGGMEVYMRDTGKIIRHRVKVD